MERTVAKIAVSKAVYAIDRPYDYLVPEELEDAVCVGKRVLVPFGNGNRGAEGIVLATGRSPAVGGPALKSIHTVLDDRPVLDEKGIRLALWMRERYFCTVYDAVKAMLPAGLFFALQDCVRLTEGTDREAVYTAAGSDPAANHLAELLLGWGGRGEMSEIRAAFGTGDPNPAIRTLIEAGAAELETTAQRGVGDKTERLAVLAVPAEEAMAQVTPMKRRAPLRYAVMELLSSLGAVSAKELCYYTGASMATVKGLERSGLLTLEKQEVFRRVDLSAVLPAGPVVLNSEQQAAFDGLDKLSQQETSAAALLYGVTGSGKTLVYIALIRQQLERGRTAMVLVPEIALTPQLLRIFASHFGDDIAVLHSSLRAGERYDEWKRIRQGKARVVLGTRSAVFAPLENIGIIVVDEEQEGSYKSENVPRYHAIDVAKYRCVQHHALLLLGSATPSIETMYRARQGIYHLFQMKNRYNQRALPQVTVVDMKDELRAGNGSSLSGPLRQGILDNLERGEQTILFLNRRGASRMVSCGQCGEVPSCPRCSVRLTYHSANHRLMCHYCGHSQPLPRACPVCGGELNFIGTGTQRVQEELEEAFPGMEVLRMDTDTVSAAHPHEELLDRFQKKKVPVLVGTQMVAKGLDFENVTLVGAVAPDLGLYVDDFRAAERTFSLLTQVVGRAGRGEKNGRALIQTYTPDNDVIRFSARQDYDRFYEAEIQMRRLRGYPPFRELFVITTSGVNEGAVLRTGVRLRQELEEGLRSLGDEPWQLLGPAPAAVAKVNNRYRYRLTLTAQNTHPLRAMLAQLLRRAQQEKENRGVSVFADVNPYNG